MGNRTAAGFQVEVESGFNCLADDVGQWTIVTGVGRIKCLDVARAPIA